MKDTIGKVPGLAVILVGQRKDSQSYVRNKIKACQEVGITSLMAELPEDCEEDEVLSAVSSFNDNPSVHGILVQLPLPQVISKTMLEFSDFCSLQFALADKEVKIGLSYHQLFYFTFSTGTCIHDRQLAHSSDNLTHVLCLYGKISQYINKGQSSINPKFHTSHFFPAQWGHLWSVHKHTFTPINFYSPLSVTDLFFILFYFMLVRRYNRKKQNKTTKQTQNS